MSYKTVAVKRLLVFLNTVFLVFPTVSREQKYLYRVLITLQWLFFGTVLIVVPISIVVKDTIFYQIPFSSRVVYDFSVVFLYFTNLYLSYLSIFRKSEVYEQVKGVLEELKLDRDFLIQFVIFVVIHLANSIALLYTQIVRTGNMYYFCTVIYIDGILTCRLVTSLFIIFLTINNIGKSLTAFNKKLSQWNSLTLIKKFRLQHNEYCDSIQVVNNLFGVVLLLIIFYFVTSFLRHAVFIRLNFGMNLVVTIVRCLWILSYMVQAAYLSHMGEKISTENQKTVAICYKLMSNLASNNVHLKTNSDIFLLAQQAAHRNNKISAAGFFNVDNTMILFMATTFFTYFIVVMQLLSGNDH